MRGTPGASTSNAVAEIHGSANGIFDVASGQLEFFTMPVGGRVNFLDNNAALIVNRGAGISYFTPGSPFGATIAGFQAGDVIALDGFVSAMNFTYDPVSTRGHA